ncbi:excinuclease ABC subunit UvrA [Paratractidigestivibacter faecalis]|uniref:excinuclease ABC subunit UvrA n=1 Tax=Paratractidigestivibacter faecalis TaxID=2292441 RepID=UPI000E3C2085|nr:excinuclease ABC subunit UvrA [Paratractidigestivibacter faecalis]
MEKSQAKNPDRIDHIEVRGARVHNLKNVSVDIPLGELVGVAGVSGSGKSSLALGVLYAEGSRRYLEALSTYTRRRISQAGKAAVDDVRYVPAALALRQRPAVPGVRSTFGTSSELLNSLRLLFSRVGSHVCPHCGAYVPPSLNVAAELPLTCPECGQKFRGPGAEELAFNSGGACPICGGTGVARTVNRAALVPDESKSIDEGAVVVWGSLMWDLMKQVCGAMGVRTDVPFCELTPEERAIVFDGPAEKRHILYKAKKGDNFAELDFTYFNAVRTVENSLAKAKDEKGLKRVAKFLVEGPCPDCGGTRLSAAARGPLVRGINLAEATQMTLDEACAWVAGVPESLPAEMRPMAASICESFQSTARRLLELGLGYLSLDRAGSTLSTGERQRVQLARSVRNRTTGVLYVMDEPSIGLHPANVDGLLGVMRDLIADGNSVVMVDHDTRILAAADHLVEMGPAAGAGGGTVVAQGGVDEVAACPESLIGPYLSGEKRVGARPRTEADDMFGLGRIHLESSGLHTVRPLCVDVPKGRLVAVTGVSGSGKTTLVLETLVPALAAAAAGEPLPAHVTALDAAGVSRANLIDATPIGTNVRSTVATYCGVLDDLRRAYARTDAAREAGYKAGDFSYNTGRLRCPTCDGTGQISLDVQFLPDVDIDCPDCRASRYGTAAAGVRRVEKGTDGPGLSLPELMALSVDEALPHVADLKRAREKLQTLHDLGLGYLTLGEATPALSGGEAQRLKLASEMGRGQADAVFVFDEPTIGLHPRDVETLLGVFQRLVDQGATVVVVEHDLDFIANADWVIDMGPGGGEAGGRVVACGTPEQVATCPQSVTGRYLG